MSEEPKKEGAEEGGAKGKSKKKLIVIIAVVLLLVVGGALGFVFMGGGEKPQDEGEHEAVEQEHEKHYATALLEPFIVNLSQNSSFIKVTILLEYDPEIVAKATGGQGGEGHGGGGSGGGEAAEAKGGLPGVLGEREPMMRDAIIRVLSGKRAEEVLTAEGKETLKDELVEAINQATALEEGPVVGVYFTEFIIQ